MQASCAINSIQNKFEELADMIKTLKAQIILISETKIDSTYPNDQLSLPGYSLYRNDRKKGGGGILALISTVVPCRRLKLDRYYQCLEPIVLDVRIGKINIIIIGIYRPPRPLVGAYQQLLKEELNHISTWASLQRDAVTVIGDLNLDRLRPQRKEGKLLLDLEMVQGFECLIKQPTRLDSKGTTTTATLVDVLLTNRPDLFIKGGVFDPALSDHMLIFGILKEKARKYPRKIIHFRSYKNFDQAKYNNLLTTALWHVGNLFDDVEDKVYYWNTIMQDIVDECFPQKKKRVRDTDIPYTTAAWKNAIRAKRRAFNKYLN